MSLWPSIRTPVAQLGTPSSISIVVIKKGKSGVNTTLIVYLQ